MIKTLGSVSKPGKSHRGDGFILKFVWSRGSKQKANQLIFRQFFRQFDPPVLVHNVHYGHLNRISWCLICLNRGSRIKEDGVKGRKR